MVQMRWYKRDLGRQQCVQAVHQACNGGGVCPAPPHLLRYGGSGFASLQTAEGADEPRCVYATAL